MGAVGRGCYNCAREGDWIVICSRPSIIGGQRLTLEDSFFPRRALKRRQRAFGEARRDVCQSDGEFLRAVCDACPTWKRQFVLELRSRLAQCCGCAGCSIRAEDDTAELHPVMGETSLFWWFITLGDLGPEETFFHRLEELYEETSGKRVWLDFGAQHDLREMWLNSCPLFTWIRAVLAKLDEAPAVARPSKARRREAGR